MPSKEFFRDWANTKFKKKLIKVRIGEPVDSRAEFKWIAIVREPYVQTIDGIDYDRYTEVEYAYYEISVYEKENTNEHTPNNSSRRSNQLPI